VDYTIDTHESEFSEATTALDETTTRELETAARTMGLEFHVLHASSEREIDTAFATLAQLRAGALVIGADALFNSRSEQLAALTIGAERWATVCSLIASAKLNDVEPFGYLKDMRFGGAAAVGNFAFLFRMPPRPVML